jgi:acid-sensing ion channel, other
VIFGHLDPENRTDCSDCVEALRSMRRNLGQVIRHCYFKLSLEDCSSVFKEMITEEGICETFNGFDIYRQENDRPDSDQNFDWTIDDGYRNSSIDFEVFPRRATKTGLILSLQLSYRKVRNDGGMCKDPIKGFKVYIHLPNEEPQISKNYYLAQYEHETQFSVDPKVITTAPEVRTFPISKRQCYFSNERYLRFFKFYTQNNCENECAANMTLSRCGCLRFNMPVVPGVKLCGIGHIKCYLQVIGEMVEQKVDQSHPSECDCLPTCNSITYDIETKRTALSSEAQIHIADDFNNLKKYKCWDTDFELDFDSEDER